MEYYYNLKNYLTVNLPLLFSFTSCFLSVHIQQFEAVLGMNFLYYLWPK